MNTNTSNHSSLLFVVENFDNAARIPALRGVTHYAMGKSIGAIRRHLNEMRRASRNEESLDSSLDQRNAYDENVRSNDDLNERAGFDVRPSALYEASTYHAVYSWCNTELQTLTTSRYELAMSLELMLDYMSSRSQTISGELVRALAVAAGTDEGSIRQMHELDALREREQLERDMPEIVLTFNGFGDNGYQTAVETVDRVSQHQIGIKIIEVLVKAKNQVLTRVMRTRQLTNLGSIPLIDDAINQTKIWVGKFEDRHGDEIGQAIENGRNVRTIEDVTQASA